MIAAGENGTMSAAERKTPFIVALDGPAGVGKTTLARNLADRLGIAYMDTGAMFRCLALRLGEGAANLPEQALREKCAQYSFRLHGKGRATTLLCNNTRIGDEIRTERVGNLASRIATRPAVRAALRDAQRSLAAQTSLVAEGRDMGTVVFPEADCKFFLDARPEVRARRRLLDLAARGEQADLQQLTEQIRDRDERDRNRAEAPLRPAQDAHLVDTSDLDVDGVLELLLQYVRQA